MSSMSMKSLAVTTAAAAFVLAAGLAQGQSPSTGTPSTSGGSAAPSGAIETRPPSGIVAPQERAIVPGQAMPEGGGGTGPESSGAVTHQELEQSAPNPVETERVPQVGGEVGPQGQGTFLGQNPVDSD